MYFVVQNCSSAPGVDGNAQDRPSPVPGVPLLKVLESYPSHIRVISESYPSHIRVIFCLQTVVCPRSVSGFWTISKRVWCSPPYGTTENTHSHFPFQPVFLILWFLPFLRCSRSPTFLNCAHFWSTFLVWRSDVVVFVVCFHLLVHFFFRCWQEWRRRDLPRRGGRSRLLRSRRNSAANLYPSSSAFLPWLCKRSFYSAVTLRYGSRPTRHIVRTSYLVWFSAVTV